MPEREAKVWMGEAWGMAHDVSERKKEADWLSVETDLMTCDETLMTRDETLMTRDEDLMMCHQLFPLKAEEPMSKQVD